MKKTSPVSRSGRFAGGPAADVAAIHRIHLLRLAALAPRYRSAPWPMPPCSRAPACSRATNCARSSAGLEAIAREIQAGKFRWNPELEDVHMNIEAELTRRVPAGAKLHTGRSRNDQVALDLRLWLREQLLALLHEVSLAPARARCAAPSANAKSSSPATPTSSGRSRSIWPITSWPTSRCSRAITDACSKASAALNVCPLGSGALAGSTLPLDRELVAHLLGFVDARRRPQLSQNSMDAVSDRDFAVEFCSTRRPARRPPLPPGRRPGPLGQRRVQLHPHRRRLHHRLLPDAAEEKPRRRRTHRAARARASSAIWSRSSRCSRACP